MHVTDAQYIPGCDTIPLHSERRKPQQQKEPYAQSLTPCCTYFRLELYLIHCCPVPFLFVGIYRGTIRSFAYVSQTSKNELLTSGFLCTCHYGWSSLSTLLSAMTWHPTSAYFVGLAYSGTALQECRTPK